MADTVDLAEYLFKRVYQIGVRSLHGVPGDYNLVALDYVAPAGLDWVGNCNELNSGYAADGYARIKGIGALVTAFGVGELSCINAIAGAWAEMAPVVHIVGTPSRDLQKRRVLMHHTMGNGDYRVFAEMYSKVTVAQANLIDAATAADMIDETLRKCLQESRPVYIELPTDMVTAQVSASRLAEPFKPFKPSNDTASEDEAVDTILRLMYSAKQPFILADVGTSRYGIIDEVHQISRLTGWPTSTTPFGKGDVDETMPNFHGVYAADHGKINYLSWAESTDLVLNFGPLHTDVNTFSFKNIPDDNKTIAFHRYSLDIGSKDGTTKTLELHVKPLLQKLLARLDHSKLFKYSSYPDLGTPKSLLKALPPTRSDSIIDQDTFYQRVSTFFRSGDIVLTETGTPSVGGRDFVFPQNTQLINSSLWLSIGYMLPAAQGAALAQRDLIAAGQASSNARTILFEGDGSLQMTAQEISTIIRKRLNVIIFVMNNDGYTIERYIHGMKAHYNDVASWRYLEAPSYFGAPTDGSYKVQTHRVETWGQLEKVLRDEEFASTDGLRMVEVMMEREDAPVTLKMLTEKVKENNKGVAVQVPQEKQKTARVNVAEVSEENNNVPVIGTGG